VSGDLGQKAVGISVANVGRSVDLFFEAQVFLPKLSTLESACHSALIALESSRLAKGILVSLVACCLGFLFHCRQ